MPTKRTRRIRTQGSQAELAAWGPVFECGTDYYGDLEAFGFQAGYEGTAAIRAAAEHVWHRLGAAYLRNRHPSHIRHRPRCWAQEQFGMPGESA